MPTPDARPQAEQTPLPRGQEKIDHDLAMARLAAEIHLRSERYAKRPKRKFVSASTTEYAWAGYLRAWVDRVERVGNLNYPDEARRRKLAGTLVISVAIRRDGSVERADVIQRSEEHTSELQSLMRISYAVFCLKKKKHKTSTSNTQIAYNKSQAATRTNTTTNLKGHITQRINTSLKT